MKRVSLSEVKDDLSRYLRVAEKQQVVITREARRCSHRVSVGGTTGSIRACKPIHDFSGAFKPHEEL